MKGMPERAYEKYAWIILLVIGIFGLGGSIAELLAGTSAVAQLGFSVLITAISFNSCRRGEKWAWYALWILVVVPGLSLLHADTRSLFDIPLVVISLLGILLPYRRFFPKRQN